MYIRDFNQGFQQDVMEWLSKPSLDLTSKISRTYELTMNFLDFGQLLAGVIHEKSPNCVSPN